MFALAIAGLASMLPLSPLFAQTLVIPAQFDSAGTFHNGLAPVAIGQLWGLIDKNGSFVVKPRFNKIGPGGAGLFPVQADASWGYIDGIGRLVIPPQYDEADSFEGGVAAIKSNGSWGFIRQDGSTDVPLVFKELGAREGRYFSARDREGWAVFRVTPGKVLTRESVEDTERLFSISNRTVVAKIKDREKLYSIDEYEDGDGFRLADLSYNFDEAFRNGLHSVRRVSEGFAAASKVPGRWGYLHMASKEFVWDRFEDATAFSGGLAAVKSNGKWGYIGRSGQWLIPAQYDAAFALRGAHAIVRVGQKRGFLKLDPEGGLREFISPQYEDAARFSQGLAAVKVNGKWGYISDGHLLADLRIGEADLRIGELVTIEPR